MNAPTGYVPNTTLTPTGGYQLSNTICPPGLEYLIHLDKIFLNQKIESFEIATGIQASNQYTIMDVHGQPLYIVREKSGWFMRALVGNLRSFEMSVYDRAGRAALLIKRPLRFIGSKIDVYNGETLLGSIEKIVFSCRPKYRISDENGVETLRISGPLCLCGWNIEFSILANNGSEIGTIRKQWSGVIRELFTNSDIFGVIFPVDLSVKCKALLLGAAILIDFGYFEQR